MSTKFIVLFCDSNGHPLSHTAFTCDEKANYKVNRKLTAFVRQYLLRNIFNLHRGERFIVLKQKDDVSPVQVMMPVSDFDNPAVMERAKALGISMKHIAVLRCKHKGLTHEQAADELRITYYAVDKRLRTAYDKLEVDCWQLAVDKLLQNQNK
jgi:DNA-directed RNA polymerase specialized sigma24 family protein